MRAGLLLPCQNNLTCSVDVYAFMSSMPPREDDDEQGLMVVTVDNQSIPMSKARRSGWRRPSVREGVTAKVVEVGRERPRAKAHAAPAAGRDTTSSTRLTSARRRRGERRLRASRRGATTSLRSTRSLRCRRTYALTSGASAIAPGGVAVSARPPRSRGGCPAAGAGPVSVVGMVVSL